MEDPREDQFTVVKYVLRYIAGTWENGLFYTSQSCWIQRH
jgi:hypothetical protein